MSTTVTVGQVPATCWPAWCNDLHDDPEQDEQGPVEHTAEAGTIWLHEVRRGPRVTTPHRGCLEVGMATTDRPGDNGVRILGTEMVRLELDGPGLVVLDLLPSEARSVARMLVKAADRLELAESFDREGRA